VAALVLLDPRWRAGRILRYSSLEPGVKKGMLERGRDAVS